LRYKNQLRHYMSRYYFFVILFVSLSVSVNCLGQDYLITVVGKTESETSLLNSLSFEEVISKSDIAMFSSSLLNQLHQLGFLDAQVDISFLDESGSKITFELGSQIKEVKVFTPADHEDLNFCVQTLHCNKNYVIIEFKNLTDYLKTLVTQLSETGRPFSAAQLTQVRREGDDRLSADLEIVPSDVRRLDDIVIKGYDAFSKSFLHYYAQLRQGQKFGLDRVKEKVNSLNQLGFVSISKDPAVLFTENRSTLYIYVSKVKSNQFDGFIGFGRSEESGQSEVFGQVDLTLINNLNYGETLRLLFKKQGNGQSEFDLNIKAPFILKTPFSLDLNLNIFRKDSIFQTSQQSLGLIFHKNINWYYDLNFSTHKSSAITNQVNSVQNYNSVFYGGGVSFNKRSESMSSLSYNSHFKIGGKIGHRYLRDGKVEQRSFHLKGQHEFNLNNRHSVYGNFESAYLISDEYLTNEMYRIGGMNSLRGFEESSIETSGYSIVKSEYRFKLDQSTIIHSVLDIGIIDNVLYNSQNTFTGIGLGLARKEFNGVLKVQFVLGKINNLPIKLSESKLHLSFLTQF